MSSKKLHVLWIPSWYTLQENPIVGIFFKEQMAALIKSDVKVGVIFPEIRPLKSISFSKLMKNYFQFSHEIEEGIPTYRLHGWNLFPLLEKAQMHLWIKCAEYLMERYIAIEGMPDVLHAHSTLWGGIAAQKIAEKYRLPYIITEHRDTFLHDKLLTRPHETCWSKPVLQQALDNASQILVVSNPLKKAIIPFTKSPLAPIVVLPCFIDTHFFNLPPAPPPKSPFRFLTIAMLEPRKNISLLLHAFHSFLKQFPDSLLEIGGDGEERDHLKKLSQKLGLENSVIFLGQLNREGARAAYQRAHVFVLPTRRETFGVVFIEAMASGLPVVTTLCGGPEDIVNDTVGTLVPVDDLDAFTNAMIEFRQNISRYDPQTIRSYAVARFSEEAVSQKLINIYSAHKKSIHVI